MRSWPDLWCVAVLVGCVNTAKTRDPDKVPAPSERPPTPWADPATPKDDSTQADGALVAFDGASLESLYRLSGLYRETRTYKGDWDGTGYPQKTSKTLRLVLPYWSWERSEPQVMFASLSAAPEWPEGIYRTYGPFQVAAGTARPDLKFDEKTREIRYEASGDCRLTPATSLTADEASLDRIAKALGALATDGGARRIKFVNGMTALGFARRLEFWPVFGRTGLAEFLETLASNKTATLDVFQRYNISALELNLGTGYESDDVGVPKVVTALPRIESGGGRTFTTDSCVLSVHNFDGSDGPALAQKLLAADLSLFDENGVKDEAAARSFCHVP